MATLVKRDGISYWEFHCAQCNKFNVHKATSNNGGKPPVYCNAKCYYAMPRFVIGKARAIYAYQLWLKGDTLQSIGNELGGVTRERARQLVIKGRIYSKDNTVDK
jgi:hypothetical protein